MIIIDIASDAKSLRLNATLDAKFHQPQSISSIRTRYRLQHFHAGNAIRDKTKTQ